VVVTGAGLLAEYDAGDGVLEHRLEHPLGATLWSRGRRTAELWTAEEITVGESLPRCRLAVLTACEAAGGGLSAVDEMTGLPAALIAAGVTTVVASLWPVDDDLAVLFTDRFYAELAAALGRPGDVDVAGLVTDVRAQLRSMTAAEAAASIDALIGRVGDVPARARLRVARVRRGSGPACPFGAPLHWAAFGVFGTGVLERHG
jgi:CHAT domain-containing protein